MGGIDKSRVEGVFNIPTAADERRFNDQLDNTVHPVAALDILPGASSSCRPPVYVKQLWASAPSGSSSCQTTIRRSIGADPEAPQDGRSRLFHPRPDDSDAPVLGLGGGASLPRLLILFTAVARLTPTDRRRYLGHLDTKKCKRVRRET